MNGTPINPFYETTTYATVTMPNFQLSNSVHKTHLLISLKAPHSSMDDLVTKALESVWNHHANLCQSITDFQKHFPWHIQQIQQKGWNKLKAELGTKMLEPHHGLSFQDFRNKANTFIDNLTCQVGKVLGLSDARWVTFGTVGYNSDVDTNVTLTCTPVDIDETALYKTLRDIIHYATLKGFSGPQLDTESYMPHAGEIDLAKHLSSDKAKMCFQTGEKVCVIFQRVICLAHMPKVYETSKNSDLASFANDDEKKAINSLYTSVEAFMLWLNKKIEARRADTLDYIEAKSLTYIPLRLKLGSRAARQQNKIRNTEDTVLRDQLYLELQRTLILLTILQTDGTFSAAEGKATILQAGGQIHAEILRRRANSMPGDQIQSSNSLDDFKPKEIYRKSSAPQASSICNFAEEFASMSITDSEAVLYFENPTAQTNLIASEEESVQLEHEIHEGLKHLTPGQAVIKSGKYALRTCKNLFLALEECKKQNKTSLRIAALAKKIKECLKKCESLEKCKRKIAISTNAATSLLTDVILERDSAIGNSDCTLVAAKVHSVFSRFDFKGVAELEVFQPQQHYESLKKLLAATEGIKIDVDNLSGNLRNRIISILQARAGFDRLLPQYDYLTPIHDEAANITLQLLKLSTKDDVLNFLAEIIDLGAKTRTIAREIGLLTNTQEDIAATYNFQEILANL